MIRSWVLGNEAHENRNGVLLFILLCVVTKTTPIMKGAIYMLDLDLFDALETMSLMDDYEFEKNGYILKRDKNENGDTDITVEKK